MILFILECLVFEFIRKKILSIFSNKEVIICNCGKNGIYKDKENKIKHNYQWVILAFVIKGTQSFVLEHKHVYFFLFIIVLFGQYMNYYTKSFTCFHPEYNIAKQREEWFINTQFGSKLKEVDIAGNNLYEILLETQKSS